MGRIRILDKTVADKIAAGEVVERPASVVKELLENAIDAKSRNIQINIDAGGQKLIEIIDDGLGMSEVDVKLAVERFATSKLNEWEDLEELRTFGFRGEALPSISAISRVEILTREKGADNGTLLGINGGMTEKVQPVGTPEGTTIRINDIFFNTPARQKFMKSPSAETAHIVGIVQKVALASPEVSFRLNSNGRTLVDFPAQMSIRERILSVWGLPLETEIIEVEFESADVRITGWICPPDKHRSHRSYQIFYVNNRYIKNQMINQAINEGFHPLLPAGRFPLALLFIEMKGDRVDVNVHPNKLEVRFTKPGEVFKAVRDGIKKSLRGFGYTPARMETEDSGDGFGVDVRHIPLTMERGKAGASGYGGTRYRGHHSSGPYLEKYDRPVRQETIPFAEETVPYAGKGGDILENDSPDELEGAFFCQLQKTYIMGSVNGEIWLVDQHTAHERINYEKLSRIREGNAESQTLLFPLTMELPPALYNFIMDKRESFAGLGFDVESFGLNTISLKTVPYGFTRLEKPEVIMDILEEVARGEPYRNLTSLMENIRATMACRASVKAGDELTHEEMVSLVRELVRMDYSNYCPHGRPVLIRMSREHIDRMFKRI